MIYTDEEIALINKYVIALSNNLQSINDEKEPNNLLIQIFDILISCVRSLQHYIESDDIEISWQSPQVKLDYEIKYDWVNNSWPQQNLSLEDLQGKTEKEKILLPIEKFLETKGQSILLILSKGVIVRKEKNTITYLLPVHEDLALEQMSRDDKNAYIQKLLKPISFFGKPTHSFSSIEKRKKYKIINRYTNPFEFYDSTSFTEKNLDTLNLLNDSNDQKCPGINFQMYDEITSSLIHGSITAVFYPLVIDIDNQTMHVPIHTSITPLLSEKHNTPIDPTTWPKDKREVFWTELIRSLENTKDSLRTSLDDGYQLIPANPVILATLKAIWNGGSDFETTVKGWDKGYFEHHHNKSPNSKIIIYFANDTSQLDTTSPRSYIEQLNSFVADIALIILAKIGHPSTKKEPYSPTLKPVELSIDEIICIKKLQVFSKEKEDFIQQVCKAMSLLSELRFDLKNWPTWNSSTSSRNTTILEQGHIFYISQKDQYCWSIHAGEWANYWLDIANISSLIRIPNALFELSNSKHRETELLAKKIGQHLTLLSADVGMNHLIVLITDILESIGELPKQIYRPKNWGRTYERFQEAISKLNRGFTILTSQIPASELRHSGWIKPWLESEAKFQLFSFHHIIPVEKFSLPVEPLLEEDKTLKTDIKKSLLKKTKHRKIWQNS